MECVSLDCKCGLELNWRVPESAGILSARQTTRPSTHGKPGRSRRSNLNRGHPRPAPPNPGKPFAVPSSHAKECGLAHPRDTDPVDSNRAGQKSKHPSAEQDLKFLSDLDSIDPTEPDWEQ